jgi:cbb3-type cytochrome oxidase subunit 1
MMMERFVSGFIRASLVWLGIGVLLGVVMSLSPAGIGAYRSAHLHANFLGFVSMMIFGVAYHVIPRFSSAPLHNRALALTHFWVAQLGLALLVIGWLGRVHHAAAVYPLRIGAILSAAGAGLFIYNVWRTLSAGEKVAAVQAARLHSMPGVRMEASQ